MCVSNASTSPPSLSQLLVVFGFMERNIRRQLYGCDERICKCFSAVLLSWVGDSGRSFCSGCLFLWWELGRAARVRRIILKDQELVRIPVVVFEKLVFLVIDVKAGMLGSGTLLCTHYHAG